MWSRSLALVGAILSLLAGVQGFYEDQMGQSDWQLKNIGVPAWVTYYSKRLFVSTESGVLAALNARTGSIEWRHLLAKRRNAEASSGSAVELVAFNKRHLATLSPQGKHVRAWQAADGALVWDAVTFDSAATTAGESELEALSGMDVMLTEQHVVVLSRNTIYFFGVSSGMLEWNLSPFEIGESESETGEPSVFADVAMSLSAILPSTGDEAQVLALGWIAPSLDKLTPSSVVAVKLSASSETVATAKFDVPTKGAPSGVSWEPALTAIVSGDDNSVAAVLSDVTGEHLAVLDITSGSWSFLSSSKVLSSAASAGAAAAGPPSLLPSSGCAEASPSLPLPLLKSG